MKTPMGGWGEMLVGVAVGIALVGGAVPLLTQPGAVTTGTPKIDVGASEGACAQIEQLDAYVNELEQSDANERDGAPERARQALEALIRAQSEATRVAIEALSSGIRCNNTGTEGESAIDAENATSGRRAEP